MESVPFRSEAIPGRHTIRYRVRDHERGFPTRDVEVLATPEEIRRLDRDGYLVRERLLDEETMVGLRAAFDELVPNDLNPEKSGGTNFGGVFLRHMMDKHPAFLAFLKFQPALSVARALFGPYVQLRGFTGRVCWPHNPGQLTEWHFHQRLIPDPIPPRYSRPQTLDVLLYLEDLNDANGPLCVVPGSHDWIETDLADEDFSEKADEVILRLPAGSAVITHGSLWHRNRPTQAGGTVRHLLLWGYGPCHQKPSIYGEKPVDGLTSRLLTDADEETRELLGIAGYM